MLLLFLTAKVSFAPPRPSINAICLRLAMRAGGDSSVESFEAVVLRHYGIDLLPTPADLANPKGAEQWKNQIDAMIRENCLDPFFKEALQIFIVEYAREHLPGDWPVIRSLRNWGDLYLQQRHYNLVSVAQGRYRLEPIQMAAEAGLVDGAREVRTKDLKFGDLFGVIERTLLTSHQLHRELPRRKPEREIQLRLEYLRLALLREGYLQWQELRPDIPAQVHAPAMVPR